MGFTNIYDRPAFPFVVPANPATGYNYPRTEDGLSVGNLAAMRFMAVLLNKNPTANPNDLAREAFKFAAAYLREMDMAH